MEWSDRSTWDTDDSDVVVLVEHFLVGDRIECGSVEVRTRSSVTIDSTLWRKIPAGAFAELAESARLMAEEIVRAGLADTWASGELAKDLAAIDSPARRPGRPSRMSRDLISNVVAPAFRTGGLRPVVAVQAALQRAGFSGSGPNGEVTINQAKAAVKAARRAGAIPAANKEADDGVNR